MKPRLVTLFLLLVQTFFFQPVAAQSYYPGGMGNSNLFLWLNANKSSSITMNGSNQVAQWSDLSGNGNHFTQATTGNKPVYGATANPAGMPGLTFTSTSSQYLSLASLSSSLSFTSGVSAFAQASYSATQTSQGWQRIFDFGNGTGTDNFMMGRYGSTANNYYEGWSGNSGDQTYTSTNPITNGTESLYEAIQQGGTAGTLTTVAHYLAGAAQTATGAAGSSKTWLPAALTRTSNYIGRSNWSADNYFSGTMSEILLYNTALNATQRVILENYLAAEWNQAVSVSKYTPPSTTSYISNLVGIGYTSSTDYFVANIPGSTDGLGFSSGTTAGAFLGSAGYLMAAHNAQSNTVITNATVPGITSSSALNRWNRSWYLQQSGGNSAGAVSLVFNFSDYNSSTPSAGNSYALLYNATDGSFATGTNKLVTTTTTTVSGNSVTFATAASNLSTGYYSILYSATPIALPVTLTAFTATRQNTSARLDWSTAQATTVSRFDIQRSADGTDFATIASVAGTTYSYTDASPLSGRNYYRLAMVDEDGTTTWSPIRTVSFDEAAITLTVYPNPVTDRLHIVFGDSPANTSIRLLNSQGRSIQEIVTTATTVDIPFNGLSKGIYFVKIQVAGGNHYIREVVKQ